MTAQSGVEYIDSEFAALRDEILPLPGADDGYQRVLLLGTTGAGKTTVVRQLLGTHPRTERFPSTSTAKTTVADMELIVSEQPAYRAAITFAPRAVVETHVQENVVAAALAVFEGKSVDKIGRSLLDHVNQRFRFSYVLGRIVDAAADDIDDDDDEHEDSEPDPAEYGDVDAESTTHVLTGTVVAIRALVNRYATEVFSRAGDADLQRFVELNADADLREYTEFHDIVDRMLVEMEKRFDALEVGDLHCDADGWPISWAWSSDDRRHLLTVVSRFSSNNAKLFGRLLTPLVNAVRVSGPFVPGWATARPKLVLIDGEGLGHTAKSAATLSTHVARRLDEVDAVLLVDNAEQPMQAAAVAALKSIAISGHAAKLHFLFTHFDQVKGDNLDTFSAREEHVRESVANVLALFRAEAQGGDQALEAAERVLRQRLDRAAYFVGGIDKQLSDKKAGKRSIHQLNALMELIAHPELADDTGEGRPVYRTVQLVDGITAATSDFQTMWKAVLSLDFEEGVSPAHWSQVKALTRRFAFAMDDHYEHLQPVADLREGLQHRIYGLLQQPARWVGGTPNPSEQQVLIDQIANAVATPLLELSTQLLTKDAREAWIRAYAISGSGSVTKRARIIDGEVFDTYVASGRLLAEVTEIVTVGARRAGVVFE
ncbi:hypothetical protein [Nocardia crassostreae]|uniref:hypothetical protein n=1 Tax=Nocardia crassostreae TaxID=53428 RepID=UPI00082C779D|nr:hypothetical protein [Nocardia crassostreae]